MRMKRLGMRRIFQVAVLVTFSSILQSCWGGPSKADLEEVFGVKIEYVECAKASGQPGYECSGRTSGAWPTTFTRRVIYVDGRWRPV